MEKLVNDFRLGFITWGEFTNMAFDRMVKNHGGEKTADEIRAEICFLRNLANEFDYILKNR